MLQRAASAVGREDAGGPSSAERRTEQANPTAQPAGTLTLLNLDLGRFPWKQIRDNDHPAHPSRQTTTIAIEIHRFHLDQLSWSWGRVARWRRRSHGIAVPALQWRNTRRNSKQLNPI